MHLAHRKSSPLAQLLVRANTERVEEIERLHQRGWQVDIRAPFTATLATPVAHVGRDDSFVELPL